jgi:hypothetical protein
MASYNLFTCPGCENRFRVIWPNPLPSHFHRDSKVKLKCSSCGEMTELYDFHLDTIVQAPEPGIPSVEVLSISPRDPNPDPDASIKWRQELLFCLASAAKSACRAGRRFLLYSRALWRLGHGD